MIVPIPNPGNNDNIGLLDVSENNIFNIRKKIADKCGYVPRGAKFKTFTNSLYNFNLSKDKLAVYNIDNYKITIANNLENLKSSVDWNQFNLPDYFEMRFNTLLDKNLYPFNRTYVICQANMSIKNDGFCIVYPDPEFD